MPAALLFPVGKQVQISYAVCSNCTADQRLCFHYTDSTIPPILIPKTSKILASMTAGQFVLDLIRNPEDRFSHVTAHLRKCITCKQHILPRLLYES